jgi:hypothetical protein
VKSGYSRAAPSPRYRRLLEQYQQMHNEGDKRLGIPAERTFPGQSLPQQAPHIKRWIERTGAQTILDYGSGKGEQYRLQRFVDPHTQVDHPDIRAYWSVREIRCFDPAYSPFAELPRGTFGGVICTDVLEHCPEDDVAWILDELFAFAEKFVFANIACFPARKRLPSGGNAHCTVKPVKWWERQVARAAAAKPALPYEFRLAYAKAGAIKEQVITSPERP